MSSEEPTDLTGPVTRPMTTRSHRKGNKKDVVVVSEPSSAAELQANDKKEFRSLLSELYPSQFITDQVSATLTGEPLHDPAEDATLIQQQQRKRKNDAVVQIKKKNKRTPAQAAASALAAAPAAALAAAPAAAPAAAAPAAAPSPVQEEEEESEMDTTTVESTPQLTDEDEADEDENEDEEEDEDEDDDEDDDGSDYTLEGGGGSEPRFNIILNISDGCFGQKKSSKPSPPVGAYRKSRPLYPATTGCSNAACASANATATASATASANKRETTKALRLARLDREQKEENAIKFRELIHDRPSNNDVQYFHDQLTTTDQARILHDLETMRSLGIKPYRLALLEADIPLELKALALRKINAMRSCDSGGGESYKLKNWVDTFMRIPFNVYKTLPVTMDDGVDKCHAFMDNAKQILDSAVYGLNDAKLQIMQLVGQWIANPTSIGAAIAIKGPMGTGKTTLVKEGISKILGRPFAFIALGGATDSAYLEGHSYTYEGAVWGRIVDIIIKSGCMNPVIYFDELDKVSETPKGEEIIGILTHLTDSSQNMEFHDRYFADLKFDLSRCLFIFSYNDESKINPILRDRMNRIMTKGYDQTQKLTIANQYLMPKIREQVRFGDGDVIIPDETITHIITSQVHEDGVRTLKRCLEIIHTKLNLYRLMKPGTNLFDGDMSLTVQFPMVVTPDIASKLITRDDDGGAWKAFYS